MLRKIVLPATKVHGRGSAVLIASEDLERPEETLEIMRDAATMNWLAEPELARGEFVSAGELAEAVRQRRAESSTEPMTRLACTSSI